MPYSVLCQKGIQILRNTNIFSCRFFFRLRKFVKAEQGFFLHKITISLLDNATNKYLYLVGCVIQKRYYYIGTNPNLPKMFVMNIKKIVWPIIRWEKLKHIWHLQKNIYGKRPEMINSTKESNLPELIVSCRFSVILNF